MDSGFEASMGSKEVGRLDECSSSMEVKGLECVTVPRGKWGKRRTRAMAHEYVCLCD